jgi:hypothetical protein
MSSKHISLPSRPPKVYYYVHKRSHETEFDLKTAYPNPVTFQPGGTHTTDDTRRSV